MKFPIIGGKKSSFNKVMKMQAEDARKELQNTEKEGNELVKIIEDLFYERDTSGKIVAYVVQKLTEKHKERVNAIVSGLKLDTFKREKDFADGKYRIISSEGMKEAKPEGEQSNESQSNL